MEQSPTEIDRAVDLLRKLPADRQRLAADLIEELARPSRPYQLSAEERAVCEAALVGPLADASQVDDLLNTPW